MKLAANGRNLTPNFLILGYLLIIPIVLLGKNAHTYFDAHWHNLPDKNGACYFRTRDSFRHGLYFVTDRYISGKIQMTGSYLNDSDEKTRMGVFKYYDTLDRITLEGRDYNNQRIGEWRYHYWKFEINDDDLVRRYENRNDYYYTIYHCLGDTLDTCFSLKIENSIQQNFVPLVMAYFVDSTIFRNDIFCGSVALRQCIFKNNVLFSQDTIQFIDFNSSKFLNGANFMGDYISGTISFSYAKFHGRLSLNNITMGKNAQLNFANCRLPKFLDFSGTNKIQNVIDLTVADFGKNKNNGDTSISDLCQINLYKADISKFKLDYEHFRLYIPPGVTNDEIYSIYEGLLYNFKSRGQLESYKTLDIEFKRLKYSKLHQGWRSYLEEWWWNFGYAKELVFLHAFVFLLFFSFITFWILGFLNDEVYSLDDIKYEIPLSIKEFCKGLVKNGSKSNSETGNRLIKEAFDFEGEKRQNLRSYIVTTSGKKLSKLFSKEGLNIELTPVVSESSEYGAVFKTLVYLLFIVSFILFLLGFFVVEHYLLKIRIVASVGHILKGNGKYLLLLAVLFIFIVWVFRRKLKKNKPLIFAEKIWSRSWLSFVYTSKLFFPLFIEIEKIKFKHQLLVFYILFVYTIGIICVGYMTNFVVQK